MDAQNAGGYYSNGNGGIKLHSSVENHPSREREFWLYYYEMLTAFPDDRKFLLENYKAAEVSRKGKINFNAVDPERINSAGGGYKEALEYVIKDIQELADNQKMTQEELEELTGRAETVVEHRKSFPDLDTGHGNVLKLWTDIVEKLELVKPSINRTQKC